MSESGLVSGRTFPRRILAVDDDPILRELFPVKLTEGGCHVDCAADGLDGLAQLDAGHELILLDLEMPNLDGFGVLEALKARTNIIVPPVVVLTSRSEARVVGRAFALGAAAYALKPVDWAQLKVKISHIYLAADRWNRERW